MNDLYLMEKAIDITLKILVKYQQDIDLVRQENKLVDQ